MVHVEKALGFTLEDLNDAIGVGDVRMQSHPAFSNLRIFNYSEDVQYRNRWNKITLACRGLILDVSTGEVVARPWEKFFNLGQMDNRIDSMAPVEVTDKVDGSLGILYRAPDGLWQIATRGSFASEQANHATTLFEQKYLDGVQLTDEATFLFEIVYPENRIVVNYGDMDDLVLLGAVDKRYGFYHGPETAAGILDWPGPVAEVWKFDHFVDAISFPDRNGKEGVVIRSGNNIVKLKQADYVELHRIVTNLSPKTIWEMLKNGKTIAGICEEIPDEFHSYVEDIGNSLIEKVSQIKLGATLAHNDAYISSLVDGVVIRKRYADVARQYPDYKGLMFSLLDNKDITEAVWKQVKPRGDIKSLVEDEG